MILFSYCCNIYLEKLFAEQNQSYFANDIHLWICRKPVFTGIYFMLHAIDL